MTTRAMHSGHSSTATPFFVLGVIMFTSCSSFFSNLSYHNGQPPPNRSVSSTHDKLLLRQLRRLVR